MLDAVARPMAATPRDAGTGADENANQEGADHRWVIVAFAAVFIGWFLTRDSSTPAVTLAPEIGLFGLLYVLAQAIERVLGDVEGPVRHDLITRIQAAATTADTEASKP